METRRQGSPSDAERWLEFVDPKHRSSHYYRGCLWRWEDVAWVNVTDRRISEAAMEKWEANNAGFLRNLETDVNRAGKSYDALPTWHELKREFPKLDVIEHEDGSKSADMRHMPAEDVKLLNEMLGEWRAVEMEKSEDLSSRRETVQVAGRVVPVDKAEKVERAMRERD